MKYFAVVDTNVLVSALLSKKEDTATVLVFKKIIEGEVIPLYSTTTMLEYKEVLAREKFNFDQVATNYVLLSIEKFGILIDPKHIEVSLPDINDIPFYEIVMDTRENNSYLITGNLKDFTSEDFIVTPAEFLKIMNK